MCSSRSLRPEWNEQLVINEEYVHFLQPKVILFAEVIDVDYMDTYGGRPRAASARRAACSHGCVRVRSEPPVAWGFLRFVSSIGRANTEQSLRIQLYNWVGPFQDHAPLGRAAWTTPVIQQYLTVPQEKRVRYKAALSMRVEGARGARGARTRSLTACAVATSTCRRGAAPDNQCGAPRAPLECAGARSGCPDA